MLVDKIPGIAIGLAETQGRVATSEATSTSGNIMTHEFLHNMGLADSYKIQNGVVTNTGESNIMQAGGIGSGLTSEQEDSARHFLMQTMVNENYLREQGRTPNATAIWNLINQFLNNEHIQTTKK